MIAPLVNVLCDFLEDVIFVCINSCEKFQETEFTIFINVLPTAFLKSENSLIIYRQSPV